MVTKTDQKLKTVDKLKLDAFAAPINTNCTISSYDFKETSTVTKGLKQVATCALSDHKSFGCWVINYPTAVFETMKYNLIVKYSTLKTLKDSNTPGTVVRTDTIP